MRILITRPRPDAEALAETLAAMGHDALIEPMLEYRPVDSAAIDLAGVQALLFTSANGVRAFAGISADRTVPVYTVGAASARQARALGFTSVHSAGGDVRSLGRLVAAELDTGAGPLLHIAGSDVAGDLGHDLGARKFTIERKILYRMLKARGLSSAARDALRGGTIDGAVFYSPRTAATFVALLENEDIQASAGSSAAFCLSPAVAEQARRLPWRQVVVAEQPTADGLLKLIESRS